MDSIAGFDVNVQNLGLVGLGILTFVGILTGKLLPRWVVDSLLRAKDEVISKQAETIEAQAEAQAATEKLLTTMHASATEQRVRDNGVG